MEAHRKAYFERMAMRNGVLKDRWTGVDVVVHDPITTPINLAAIRQARKRDLEEAQVLAQYVPAPQEDEDISSLWVDEIEEPSEPDTVRGPLDGIGMAAECPHGEQVDRKKLFRFLEKDATSMREVQNYFYETDGRKVRRKNFKKFGQI